MTDQHLLPLFDKYKKSLKPLIAEYESRNEDFVTPLLLKLSFVLDSIALYHVAERDSEKIENVNNADNYLEQCIKDVKASILSLQIKRVATFENMFPESVLIRSTDGHFIGPYTKFKDEFRSKRDSNDIHGAYKSMCEIESLMDNSHDSIIANNLTEDSKYTVWLKYTITVLLGVLVTALTTWLL